MSDIDSETTKEANRRIRIWLRRVAMVIVYSYAAIGVFGIFAGGGWYSLPFLILSIAGYMALSRKGRNIGSRITTTIGCSLIIALGIASTTELLASQWLIFVMSPHVVVIIACWMRPDVAPSLKNLAMLYHTQGDYARAEPLYKRSLAIEETALGPDHPDVAASLNSLAALYDTQGDYARAEPLYKRSLAIEENALGPDHPDVAPSLHNLAALYQTQGYYAKAEPLYKRSLAIWENALGPDHPDVAQSLENLADLYRVTKRVAEAEELEQRAAKIRTIKR